MPNFESEAVRRLYRAVALLQTEEECAAFFQDVCTVTELQDMAQRLEAAILLDQGENYQAVTKKAGLSSATISRVSRCLNYGAGGYRAVIRRLEEAEKTP